MRIDVHQHIWTEPLVRALTARSALPLVRVSDGLCVLHSAAEQPYLIDVAAEAPDRRAALVRRCRRAALAVRRMGTDRARRRRAE
jgi:hypothetical protein